MFSTISTEKKKMSLKIIALLLSVLLVVCSSSTETKTLRLTRIRLSMNENTRTLEKVYIEGLIEEDSLVFAHEISNEDGRDAFQEWV